MIEYCIDEPQGLIRVRMSGSNSVVDLQNHFAEVYRDPRYNQSLRTLFQVDEDAGGPLMSELPMAKHILEIAAQSQHALKKWAVVIPSGFKRMMVEFMLRDMQLNSLQMRFFPDPETALVWLREP